MIICIGACLQIRPSKRSIVRKNVHVKYCVWYLAGNIVQVQYCEWSIVGNIILIKHCAWWVVGNIVLVQYCAWLLAGNIILVQYCASCIIGNICARFFNSPGADLQSVPNTDSINDAEYIRETVQILSENYSWESNIEV